MYGHLCLIHAEHGIHLRARRVRWERTPVAHGKGEDEVASAPLGDAAELEVGPAWRHEEALAVAERGEQLGRIPSVRAAVQVPVEVGGAHRGGGSRGARGRGRREGEALGQENVIGGEEAVPVPVPVREAGRAGDARGQGWGRPHRVRCLGGRLEGEDPTSQVGAHSADRRARGRAQLHARGVHPDELHGRRHGGRHRCSELGALQDCVGALQPPPPPLPRRRRSAPRLPRCGGA
mmetsp:Transcript_12383/g.37077  ORF Transcript_12383/g.37077 Transcript_12383/m.37077 type:complete len:235 (+) Transcript_12383:524-1228(+)